MKRHLELLLGPKLGAASRERATRAEEPAAAKRPVDTAGDQPVKRR